jgi:hypothetical protein
MIGTSLPPRVAGELTGELELRALALQVAEGTPAPRGLSLRVHWWGEESVLGTRLVPATVRGAPSATRGPSSVWFPLRSVLPRVIAYLNDMVSETGSWVRGSVGDGTVSDFARSLSWRARRRATQGELPIELVDEATGRVVASAAVPLPPPQALKAPSDFAVDCTARFRPRVGSVSLRIEVRSGDRSAIKRVANRAAVAAAQSLAQAGPTGVQPFVPP